MAPDLFILLLLDLENESNSSLTLSALAENSIRALFCAARLVGCSSMPDLSEYTSSLASMTRIGPGVWKKVIELGDKSVPEVGMLTDRAHLVARLRFGYRTKRRFFTKGAKSSRSLPRQREEKATIRPRVSIG